MKSYLISACLLCAVGTALSHSAFPPKDADPKMYLKNTNQEWAKKTTVALLAQWDYEENPTPNALDRMIKTAGDAARYRRQQQKEATRYDKGKIAEESIRRQLERYSRLGPDGLSEEKFSRVEKHLILAHVSRRGGRRRWGVVFFLLAVLRPSAVTATMSLPMPIGTLMKLSCPYRQTDTIHAQIVSSVLVGCYCLVFKKENEWAKHINRQLSTVHSIQINQTSHGQSGLRSIWVRNCLRQFRKVNLDNKHGYFTIACSNL